MLLELGADGVDRDCPAPLAFDHMDTNATGLGDVGHVLTKPTVAHNCHTLAGGEHAADGHFEPGRAGSDNGEHIGSGAK